MASYAESMNRLKLRPVRFRSRQRYDRHRRIKKRLTFGGMIWGKEMPIIKRTWGQWFIAKRRAKELELFFNEGGK